MPDYTPQEWETGDTFTAAEATAMSAELGEQEDKDVAQDAARTADLAAQDARDDAQDVAIAAAGGGGDGGIAVVTYAADLGAARPDADAVYWVDFPSTPTNAEAQDIVAGETPTTNIYYVTDHDLVGDWTGGDADAGSGTNDTTDLETLIALVPAGSTLVFDGTKNYRLDPVVITKALTLDFNGASVVTKTMDSGDLTVGAPFISFISSVGTARAISSAALNAGTVTTTTAGHAADFAVGDYVVIYDSKTILKWDTGAGAATGETRGEVNIVKSAVAGTGVVTLAVPLSTDVATTPKIQKITSPIISPIVKNVGLIIDTDPGAIYNGGVLAAPYPLPNLFYFQGCIDPRVENVKADGWELHIANFYRCMRPRTLDVQGKNPFYTSAGHGYIGRMSQCVDGEFERSVGYGARHVADYVGGARCGSRNCTSYDNVQGAYITHGFEAHDTYSIDDKVAGSATYGWGLGNTQYNADYGFCIVRPTYYGLNRAIVATSNSTGLRVTEPNIHAYTYPVKIEEGASDIVIDTTNGVIENVDPSSGFSIWATASAPQYRAGNVTIIGNGLKGAVGRYGISLDVLGDVTLIDVPAALVTIVNAANVYTSLDVDISDAASKTTPVDADTLALVDSAAAAGTKRLKKLTWASLKATALIPGSTSTATAAATTTLTVASTEVQIFTGSTTQTVALPTTSVVAGQRYTVVNTSSGSVTVQSSGANTIATLTSGQAGTFLALQATPTTAAHWQFQSAPNISPNTGSVTSSLAARNASGNIQTNAFIPDLTSTATAAGTTTLTVATDEIQVFTGTLAQTVLLPTTGVAAGHRITIINQSTSGSGVTVQSSGANTIASLYTNHAAMFIALQATPTTAAHWAFMSAPGLGVNSGNAVVTIPARDSQGNLFSRNFTSLFTATATAAGTTALAANSGRYQVFTGSTTQTVTLPTTSVPSGYPQTIINTSTGAVTVNASGGTLVATLASGQTLDVVSNQATPTTDAHWSVVGGSWLIAAPADGSVTTAKFAAAALVTAAEGLASSDNDTSVPTTAAVIDAVAAGPGGGGSPDAVDGSAITTSSALQTLVDSAAADGKVVALEPGQVITFASGATGITIPTQGGIVCESVAQWKHGAPDTLRPRMVAQTGFTGAMVTVTGGTRGVRLRGFDIDGASIAGATYGLIFANSGTDLENSHRIEDIAVRRVVGTGISGRIRTSTFHSVNVFECGTGVSIGANGAWFDTVWSGGYIALCKNVGVKMEPNGSGVASGYVQFNHVRVERTGQLADDPKNGTTSANWVNTAPGWDIKGAYVCTWNSCTTDANNGPGVKIYPPATDEGYKVRSLLFINCIFNRDGQHSGAAGTALSTGVSVVGLTSSGADHPQSIRFMNCMVVPGESADDASSTYSAPEYGVTVDHASHFTWYGTSVGDTTGFSVGTNDLWQPEIHDPMEQIFRDTGLALKVDTASPTFTSPVINGTVTGTGQASAATASVLASRDANANLFADAFIPGFTTTATAAGTTTLTVDSTEVQHFSGSTTQTVVLPTTGVTTGHRITVINQSTNTVTVQSSDTDVVSGISAARTVTFVALVATPTDGTHWLPMAMSHYHALGTSVNNSVALRTADANLLADVFIPGSTSTATAAGTTTLTISSTQVQIFTGSTTQTMLLPTTSVAAGQAYTVIDTSSGNVTVQSSGANTIATLTSGQSGTFIALQATPTTAAHWQFQSAPNISPNTGSVTSSLAARNGSANLLADNFIPSGTSTVTAAGTLTLTVDSHQYQVLTGSTTHTVQLATTSVSIGWPFVIDNASSGAVAVNSSGANLIVSVPAGKTAQLYARQATPTAAAHWGYILSA